MKKLLLIPAVLLGLAVFPQTFQKNIGGTGTDEIMQIQQTADSGYALFGYTQSYGAGGDDLFLIKTNSHGHIEWSKTYGGANGEHFGYGMQTNDKGYILTTHTHTFATGTYPDIILVKTDSSGNLQWAKHIGDTGQDEGYFVRQTLDSGYIITGFTDSYGAGVGDIYLVKTDKFGSVQWSKAIGGNAFDWGIRVEVISNGYLITGMTQSFSGTNNIFLCKTDNNGIILWFKTYGGSDDYRPCWLDNKANDNYLILGEKFDFVLGYRSVLLLKVDTSGNLQWTKEYIDTTTFTDMSCAGLVRTNSGLLITGNVAKFNPYENYISIIKTDTIGNIQWAKLTQPVNAWRRGAVVTASNDGGFVMSGMTTDIALTNVDVLFMKTDSFGNSQCGNIAFTPLVLNPSLISGAFSPSVVSGGIDSVATVTVTTPPTDCNWLCTGTFTIGITNTSDTICIGDSIQLYATGGISFNWTPNSTLNNATIVNPTATPDTTTTYFVTIIDSFGCKANDSIKIVVEVCSDINNQTIEKQFLIFPNPFSTQTVLKTDNLFHSATLTLYNCFGQTVKQFVISRNEFGTGSNSSSFVISRDNLPSGLYFIRLAEGSQTLVTEKLIITD